MFRHEDIRFQVCRGPNVKFLIVERSHRTIRNELYKYFTYKNTYRYIDILPKFVEAYNDTVHTATDMALSQITDSDILAILNKMRNRQMGVKRATTKFRAGQHVIISKKN